MTGRIIQGDCLDILRKLDRGTIRFAYLDPPFNTGKTQKRNRIKATASESGDRQGFGGRRYKTEVIESESYEDSFDDFEAFLMTRIGAALPLLTEDGSLFVHLDYREVHYIKVALDKLLGRECFMNEIIWAYDYGGRSKTKWSTKHDTILWYALDPKNYLFDYEAMERIPYMAPELVGPEKAARGKTPTDVFWHTIVPTNGKEKTGYPTQKPLGLLRRLIKVHTQPGDIVLDFFAGSGTTAYAAAECGRNFIAIDSNPSAIRTMRERLAVFPNVRVEP
jgi:site-specific DNA-methyltransferase (adenine-specific)